MTHQIEPIPPGAAEPLARLHRAAFPDEPWEAKAMGRILELAGLYGWFAWAADCPAGFILVRDLGTEGEILSIGVAPGCRRRGIALALIETAIAETRRRGIPSLVLEVAVDNEPALALYERVGFKRVGQRPRYYRRPDGRADALILRRSSNRATPPG